MPHIVNGFRAGTADAYADMNAGNAMVAARQAATAQLELFRAEMAAESAKMRAVVERQVAWPYHVCCPVPAAAQDYACLLILGIHT